MPQHAARMGRQALTGRALRFPVPFVRFALVFRLTASAGEGLGEPLGTGGLQIRHDTAGVDALLAALTRDHHAACAGPWLGLVAR